MNRVEAVLQEDRNDSMTIIIKKQKLTFLERIYIVEAAKGMVLTLGHFLKNLMKPETLPTLNYPEEKRTLAPNFRGRHQLLKNEKGELKCVACKLCQNACPAGCIAIEVGTVEVDGKNKKFPVGS